MAITNGLLDPETGMRIGRLEELAVKRLQAGGDIRYFGSDRRLQKAYFDAAPASVEVLVLGSSRAMPVSRRQIGGRTLWNASVTSAGLDELAMMYLRAAPSRLAPRTVVLSLDLRHFLPFISDIRWRRLWSVAEFESAGRELGEPLVPARTLALLRLWEATAPLSPSDFQRAFVRGAGVLLLRIVRDPAEALLGPADPQRYVLRRPDGSVSFPPRPLVAAGVELPGGTPGALVGTEGGRLDESGFRLLEALVARIRVDRRTVVLLMPPYEPRFAARPEVQPLVAESDRLIHLKAATWQVRVVGSFDPRTCGCLPMEFLDATHPSAACFDRLLAGVLL
jgi:hypothetical protein